MVVVFPASRPVVITKLCAFHKSLRKALLKRRLPKRIYLIRHGESQGNVDEEVYARIPDNKIPLTARGRQQAVIAGVKLWASLLKANSDNTHQRTKFWISPHRRSSETAKLLLDGFGTPAKTSVVVRHEPRLREQDFGNFREHNPQQKKFKELLEEREKYGRFYYRFPNGESGADVYDRVSTFMETLYRDLESGDFDSICLVSHGLTCRLFLMRFLRWPVETFEKMANFNNCEIAILEKDSVTGSYALVTNDVHSRSADDTFAAWCRANRSELKHS